MATTVKIMTMSKALVIIKRVQASPSDECSAFTDTEDDSIVYLDNCWVSI